MSKVWLDILLPKNCEDTGLGYGLVGKVLAHKCEDPSLNPRAFVKCRAWLHKLLSPFLGRQNCTYSYSSVGRQSSLFGNFQANDSLCLGRTQSTLEVGCWLLYAHIFVPTYICTLTHVLVHIRTCIFMPTCVKVGRHTCLSLSAYLSLLPFFLPSLSQTHIHTTEQVCSLCLIENETILWAFLTFWPSFDQKFQHLCPCKDWLH